MTEYVDHFMRRGAITCSEATSLRDIAQIMVVNRVRYCVVINDRHEIKGLLSADSILNAFGGDICFIKAKDILTQASIVTTTAGAPLAEALAVMSEKKVEHLIVTSDRPGSKAVLGILCSKEIIAKMAHRKEEEAKP